MAAEYDKEIDAREIADGLCAILLGRDGDDVKCGFEKEGIERGS